MRDRPYFQWDVPATESELREYLHQPDPRLRAQWQGCVLREARFHDVWKYVTLEECCATGPTSSRTLDAAGGSGSSCSVGGARMDSSPPRRPSRLRPLQHDLLEGFFAREQRFFLTGGAALAGFYLGHRETEDQARKLIAGTEPETAEPRPPGAGPRTSQCTRTRRHTARIRRGQSGNLSTPGEADRSPAARGGEPDLARPSGMVSRREPHRRVQQAEELHTLALLERPVLPGEGLKKEGSFQAAEARYTAVDQVDTETLGRWLAEAREIQWDYRTRIRRKGQLERLR